MVIVAVDPNQPRAIHQRIQNLRRLQIRRNQNRSLQPQTSRLRRDRVCQIAGGRAAHRLEAKLLRIRQRHRNHAILERQRRKANSVILHVQIVRANPLAQRASPHQRRKAHRDIWLEALGNRQQRSIPPDVERPCGDVGTRKLALFADDVEIVRNLQRRQAIGAAGKRAIAKSATALIALQLIGLTGIFQSSAPIGQGGWLVSDATQLEEGRNAGRIPWPRHQPCPIAPNLMYPQKLSLPGES